MDEKTNKTAAKILEAIYQEIDLFRRLSGPSTESVLYLGHIQRNAVLKYPGSPYDGVSKTFNAYTVVFVEQKDYLRMA